MERSITKALIERCDALGGDLLTSVNLPWARSLIEGDSAGAVAALESALDLAKLSDRLWWVYAQVTHGGVPLAALTSPFDELTQQLPESERLLATLTGVSLACRLVERDQRRIALTVFERCLELADPDFTPLIRGVYRDVLKEELARAEGRKERRSYLEQLEKKIAGVEELKGKKKPQKQVSSPPLVEGTKQPEAPLSADDVISDEASSEAETSAPSSRTFPWIAFAVVSGVAVVTLFTLEPDQIPPGALAMSAVEVDGGEAARAMTLPEIPMVARRKAAPSALDEVEKRLQNLAKRSSGVEQTAPPADSGDKLVSIKSGAERGAETVSVPEPTGPHYYDPKPRGPKLPELDSEQLAKNVLESLDTVERRIQPELRDSKAALQLDGKALDGSPLQAYEVERFNQPLIFKTIASTNVLSAPSVLGTAIARLDTNATIQVTSRMGQWLQVRSTGGRTGYIYAQDAVEAGKKE